MCPLTEAFFPKFDAWSTQGESRGLIPTNYPLTATCLSPWLRLRAGAQNK